MLCMPVLTIVFIAISVEDINMKNQINNNENFDPSCYGTHKNINWTITDYEIIDKNLNSTLCTKLLQYKLGIKGKRLSVCNYEGNVRVDIRQFIGTEPGIIGIWLNMNEWSELSLMIHAISSIIHQEDKKSRNLPG